MEPKTILWIDDDIYSIYNMIELLKDEGFNVISINNIDEAIEKLDELQNKIDIVILDIMMPPGKTFSTIESKGGFASGLALARYIKKEIPHLPIICFSGAADTEDIISWFQNKSIPIVRKPSNVNFVIKTIKRYLLPPEEQVFKPKIFIVHGHNKEKMLELKNFLQNFLELGEPIILHEQPSLGRTIIEKFEDISKDVDIVFVLLTPDDKVATENGTNKEKRISRQNIIFELGYFYAKLQRRSGKVILLYLPPIELPSDISGIVYLNIEYGLESVSEQIRRELSELF